ARLHREMPAIMAGDADLRGRPQNVPRLTRIAIPLSQMHTIGAEALGERDAVIDDEGDIALGAELLQRRSQARDAVLVESLEAQLKGGDRATVECGLELFDESHINHGRRNQIELARRA